MKAIILAAGRGSRLGEETQELPKCLIPFQGKPLLAWQVAALKQAGINDIGIVTGYQAEKIEFPELTKFVNPHWERTNMVASLSLAGRWLIRETCVISYADIFYPAETVRALAATLGDWVISYNTQWRALWEARFDHPLEDAESFRMNKSGRLIEIGKRVDTLDEIQGQFMGLVKVTPAGWLQAVARLNEEPLLDWERLDMTTLLQHLIEAGTPIETVSIDGNWLEFDTSRDLALAKAGVLS